MTTIPGFLTKTYEIFNTPEYIDCCGWGNDGSTIVIKKIEQFSKSVLPKYFKHSNFQSFVRQLNMVSYR
jgi:heat shock transcription factor